MTARKKNMKPAPDDFLKYRENRMSGSERNAFEKDLQKDPFSEEAAEGYAMIEGEEAGEDMKYLYKQLKNRTVKNHRWTYYRIAASIAVLMLISSVYIVLDKSGTPKLNENVFAGDTIEIRQKEALKQSSPPSSGEIVPSRPAMSKAERKAEIQIPANADRSVSDESATDSKEDEEEETIKIDQAFSQKNIQEVKDDNSVASGQVGIPAASPQKTDSFLASVSEKKASARSVSIDREAIVIDQPPQPVAGRDSFDIYILKNIRIPEEHTPGQAAVVTLSLKIDQKGIIEAVKVVKTPGREYSAEAVRLIKEGPEWQPAVRDGETIGETIKLDIVFR